MIQNSDDWFAARRGKITASRLGDVIAAPTTKRYQGYQQELVDDLNGVPSFEEDGKPWFKHGAEMESEARDHYEWYLVSKGDNVTVSQVAMLVHPEYDFISCSPDLVIWPRRGGEIKSRISDDAHKKSIKAGLPSVNKPQVLGSLWISGFDSWDFISFFKDPDGRIDTDLDVTTIYPDTSYFKRLEDSCLKFWEEVQKRVK